MDIEKFKLNDISNWLFNVSKADWHSVVYIKSFFLLRKGSIGVELSAKAGKYLWRP